MSLIKFSRKVTFSLRSKTILPSTFRLLSSQLESYARGTQSQLIEETIGINFDRQVQQNPDGMALIVKHQNIHWTYQQFQSRVNIVANKLLSLGIQPGDRVGIWSPNNSEWTLTQFATAKMGAILVNINPSYQRDELQYALNLVGCKALILAPSLKSTNYIEIIQNLCPELSSPQTGQPLRSHNIPSLQHVIRLDEKTASGMLNFTADILPFSSSSQISSKDSQESAQLQSIIPSLKIHDAINIQFTSGTTGRPKGATLTHHNILNNGYFVGQGVNLKRHEKVCIPVPLYHCFGMVMGNIACVTHGATMVYPSATFDPIETLTAISQEGCHLLYGVPTMFISQLEHPEFHLFNLSTLRGGITAGSLCPSSLMNQLITKMNLKEITNCYGMTETSPVSTQTKVNDSFEKKITTVGVAHPNVELRIVRPIEEAEIMDPKDAPPGGASDRVVVLPRGETGELWVKGYSVMKGYWNDEKKTKESIVHEGWMRTGDLASMTSDGYIIIEGRLKDMIIRGGENIYPKEIEEYLYHHPLVQDVQVVGLPDKKYGEEVCAWIILKENENQTVETSVANTTATRPTSTKFHHVTEDDIRKYCKGKIAHYKIPRYIRFVKSFPMTISGKIRKIEIRETMIKELGLKEEEKGSLA